MPVLIPDPNRTPIVDITTGGQNGILQSPFQWTSNAPYVRQKIIAVLITAPYLMQYMDAPDFQLAALKSLIELMAIKIDGLQSTVSWDYDGPVVGHAGESFKSVIKAMRTPSAPSHEWPDKYGMAVTRYWTEYGRQIISDPDLQVPGIVASPAYINAGSPPILPDQQTMTVLYIEPDVTLTQVTNAWLCTNMQPLSGGEIIGKREMGGSNETPTVTIEFTALTQIGKAVNILANQYLATLNLTDLRPLELSPYANGIDPNVQAAAAGIAESVSASVLPPSA